MSFDLEQYISKPVDKAPMITLTGDPGIGKTSLAATFEKPIFIQAEAGMDAIPAEIRPKAFPRIASIFPDGDIAKDDFSNLMRALQAVLKAPHGYKTLVIDSLTSIGRILEEEILLQEPKKHLRTMTLAWGGFQKAYVVLAERFRKIHDMCEKIRDEREMTIVYIAHSKTEVQNPPDSEPYSKYVLQLHKDSRPVFVDGVDILAYMTLDLFTKGEKNDKVKKAVSTGQRIVRCTTNAQNDAKNRYDIEGDIPVVKGVNPFFDYVPSLMQYAQAEEGEAE